MKQSLGYHIVLFILKLKGIKKIFSKDPLDYKKVRRDDVKAPSKRFYKRNEVRDFKVKNSSIAEVKNGQVSDRLLIFIHGGAFVSGPVQHHWDAIEKIAKHTSYVTWMCKYPKAPEHKISEISDNIDAVYSTALETYEADKIVLLGDSVGATLIAALVQRLVKGSRKLPGLLVLVSPVMDATLTNPKINEVDLVDPMLSKKGVLSAKKMCAENGDLKDPKLSPLYGSFDRFPQTLLYAAENDITYPDQELLAKKLLSAGVQAEIINGENMPHIWPFLPVMEEATSAFQGILKRLRKG